MNSFLLGPLVVSLITLVLALVIAAIDRAVNDYGTVTIDINSGKKRLTVKGGAPLLGTLASEGVFVPSACGGKGSCGACKTKVLTDVGPHLPTETPYMTPEEIAGNVRLACQVKVKKDLAIVLPESLFSVRKYRAKVASIKNVTHDIKEVLFKLVDPAEIDFAAGQYIQVVVPPYGNMKESVQRAYSMSSRPTERDRVELLVRLVPGGIATTWVHTVLAEGMEAELVGPFGDFGLRDSDAAMICVAGGSGMAPFRSMFRDMLERDAYPKKEIWYFFGARSKRDAFYLEELAEMERKWPRFHFVPALSEPKPEDAWEGPTGIITEVLDRWLKEKVPQGPREGYLCGSPGMIAACVDVMKRNGISEDKVYFDKF